MGTWAEGDGQRYEAAGADTSITAGTNLTASGSAHTKGSYTQLIASTAFDACGFLLTVGTGNSALFLVDIAVGGAGSEIVIVSNLLVQITSTNSVHDGKVFIPIPIPAGTRLSARCQSNTGSQTIRVMVHLLGSGFAHPSPLGRVTDYGTVTGTTRGAVVDPGGTANTKGSYSEITSSTTNRIRALVLAFGFQASTTAADTRWLVDIAVGAAAAEQIVIPDLYVHVSANLDEFLTHFIGPLPIHIPSGTRIAARAQCSETTAASRDFDLAIYGID